MDVQRMAAISVKLSDFPDGPSAVKAPEVLAEQLVIDEPVTTAAAGQK
jgi:hypothetical protein